MLRPEAQDHILQRPETEQTIVIHDVFNTPSSHGHLFHLLADSLSRRPPLTQTGIPTRPTPEGGVSQLCIAMRVTGVSKTMIFEFRKAPGPWWL